MKAKYLPYAILFLTLILRIPSFFEPYWYGDEGIRLTVAQNWFSGGTLYRDVYDNAPPLLYLLFGAGKTLAGVKILATIWVSIATFSFYFLATEITKRIAGKTNIYPLVATLLFVMLTSTPILEGNIANGEIFFILPVILAMSVVFELSHGRGTMALFSLAGVLFALATLIKIPSITDFLAALIFISVFPKFSFDNLRKKIPPLLFGFFIPWFITFSIFILTGNFYNFWYSVFGYNFSYVNYANSLVIPQGYLFLKIALACLVSSLIWRKRKLLGQEYSFVLLWLVFAFLGSFLGGRNYPHYLLQTTAPFSLVLPFFLLNPSLLRFIISLLLISIFVLLFSIGGFPRQRVFSYYQNFIFHLTGLKDERSYLSWFDKKTPRLYTLAGLIQTKTKPDECVFVYGDEPNFYPLAQRCPATFIITAYHLDFGPDFRTKALRKLITSPPHYIITIKNTPSPYKEFFDFLKTNYRKWVTIEDATIWQK